MERTDPQSTIETAPVLLARNSTASGGWEWFLVVDGERVQHNGSGCGFFTDADCTPAAALEVLLRLLS